MCLLHWAGPLSWLVAYIAAVDVQRIDELHDCRDDDLVNGVSRPIAFDIDATLFL